LLFTLTRAAPISLNLPTSENFCLLKRITWEIVKNSLAATLPRVRSPCAAGLLPNIFSRSLLVAYLSESTLRLFIIVAEYRCTMEPLSQRTTLNINAFASLSAATGSVARMGGENASARIRRFVVYGLIASSSAWRSLPLSTITLVNVPYTSRLNMSDCTQLGSKVVRVKRSLSVR